MINPILLAGADAMRQHMDRRVEEWTQKKGESTIDFDHFFAEIMEQWSLDDQEATHVNIDEFEFIEGIDDYLSHRIKQRLSDAGILNPNGFINLKTITDDQINQALDYFTELNDDQKKIIKDTLTAIQSNQPIDFETFTSQAFVFSSDIPELSPYTISESTANDIWSSLNENNIIDDYGILQLVPGSDALSTAVYRLEGITEGQKKRVLSLLNKHPELSYHNYLKQFNQASDNPEILPKAGIYFANKADVQQRQALSKKELDYIKIISILEWSVFSISIKSSHKSNENKVKRIKDEKKENEKKDLQFYEKLRIQAMQRNKENKKTKGSKRG